MSDLSTITEELAAQIKRARRDANLTQQELALQLGVSHRTLQNWEAGNGFPRAAHRRRIAAFLNNEEVAA
jgi:transcriptional regulator with XRE-family HTH domain